ncbi:MAG TPA: hypothetical protein VFN99_03345, partial [Gaiella sp.]|nr:hypothetical protein [Gaiella sp.]
VPRADGAQSVHEMPDLRLSEEAFPTSARSVEPELVSESDEASDEPPDEAVASDPAEATEDAPQADDIPTAEAAEALNIEEPADEPAAEEPVAEEPAAESLGDEAAEQA